ncbi:putative L-type lectin-domain containing receptor kinase I.4 [Hypsizygus marmoreus]|uniref:L-type lectin-domain containing receptor kinase I.4 n=1 Tax=Hypsizygus marmoreus TaxID=39966 RepID=A0A369JQ71_HYPMA|nr:putative L-type lectin-domain containing receptor kinase I.4 [Hypsizygus marmoreus]
MAGYAIQGQNLSGHVRKTSQYTIGTGGITDVFKGEWTAVGSRPIVVAIKIFRDAHNLEPATRDKIRDRLIRESRAWHGLDYLHVQPYFGYCDASPEIGPFLALISPFLQNGTVMQYLKANPDKDRLTLVSHVAKGLNYLHEKMVIHGDLSARNILIDDDGNARLADFGRAKVIGQPGYDTTLFAGSTEYMAPELFPKGDQEPVFTKMSDVYAFSMVAFEVSQLGTKQISRISFLLELFTDRTPLQRPVKVHQGRLINYILEGNRPERRHDTHRRISDEMWTLMTRCWVSESSERPTAAVPLSCLQPESEASVLVKSSSIFPLKCTFPASSFALLEYYDLSMCKRAQLRITSVRRHDVLVRWRASQGSNDRSPEVIQKVFGEVWVHIKVLNKLHASQLTRLC